MTSVTSTRVCVAGESRPMCAYIGVHRAHVYTTGACCTMPHFVSIVTLLFCSQAGPHTHVQAQLDTTLENPL